MWPLGRSVGKPSLSRRAPAPHSSCRTMGASLGENGYSLALGVAGSGGIGLTGRVCVSHQRRAVLEMCETTAAGGSVEDYVVARIGDVLVVNTPPTMAVTSKWVRTAPDYSRPSTTGAPSWRGSSRMDPRYWPDVYETPLKNLGYGASPTGRLEPTDDGEGYMLSGSWPLMGGVLDADWAAVGCLLADGDGPPVMRQAMIPTEPLDVNPVWKNSVAIRGSGSHQVSLPEPIRVPAGMVIDTRSPAHIDRPSYRYPSVASVVAVGSGLAVGMLDTTVRSAGAELEDKVGAVMGTEAAKNAVIQEMMAEAFLTLTYLRSGISAALENLWGYLERDEPPPPEVRAAVTLRRSTVWRWPASTSPRSRPGPRRRRSLSDTTSNVSCVMFTPWPTGGKHCAPCTTTSDESPWEQTPPSSSPQPQTGPPVISSTAGGGSGQIAERGGVRQGPLTPPGSHHPYVTHACCRYANGWPRAASNSSRRADKPADCSGPAARKRAHGQWSSTAAQQRAVTAPTPRSLPSECP